MDASTDSATGFHLHSRYAQLPERLYERAQPTPVRAPRLLLWNAPFAEQLGIDEEISRDREALARLLGGNELSGNSTPIALAYAGHQFGQFVPQLGDGRAHLLGELVDSDGTVRDLQLKGSGRTPFSRGGDGRCALKPAVREYLMSEAMHALGIPTARCLAVVTTGEPVFREEAHPGAIVARVAASHLRVGTLQYFAARRDHEAVQVLVDEAIARHYADIEATGPERYVAFLESVIERQIALIVAWMRVGFIHGVMNTDNTALSGETIDYGPCAMMGPYDPQTVFSSIDHQGRYAFGNQPAIAQWNMTRLAECLIPLIDDDSDRAIEQLQPMIEDFAPQFQQRWQGMMRSKLGFKEAQREDAELVEDLLTIMHEHKLDYTLTFVRLGGMLHGEEHPELTSALGSWLARWRARIDAQDDRQGARKLMERSNPLVIPRNHHVEAVLEQVEANEDGAPAESFLEVLRKPYEQGPNTHRYQDPDPGYDAHYRTFCGT